MSWRTGGLRFAGWALCACAGLAGSGCDGRTAGSPSAPEVAAGPPPEPPYPVVSQCASSTIRVGSPRRIDDPGGTTCTEAYEVDFVVEGGPGDAMLLDMFQSHTLWNWRVRDRGSTVEHAFSLRLIPSWFRERHHVPLIRPHEPIVLQRCPEDEGEGPVLACTTERCGLYEDVAEVPELMPTEVEVAVSYPGEFVEDVAIPAGGAVRVPLTFRGYRPLSDELIVAIRDAPLVGSSRRPDLGLEIEPSEIRLPAGWSGTETIPYSVRVRTTYAELRELCPRCPEVRFGVATALRGVACVIRPASPIRFRVPLEEESATSSTR